MVSLQLAEIHAIIAEEGYLVLARSLYHTEDGVDFERFGLQDSLIVVKAEHVDVTKVLSKDQILLFLTALVVLINDDVVNSLLQLLVLFLLEGVQIEHK